MFQFMTSQTYSWGRLHGISRNGNVMGTLYANLLEDHGITIRLSLVGGIPTPLKNMNSSVGMMTFPIYGK